MYQELFLDDSSVYWPNASLEELIDAMKLHRAMFAAGSDVTLLDTPSDFHDALLVSVSHIAAEMRKRLLYIHD